MTFRMCTRILTLRDCEGCVLGMEFGQDFVGFVCLTWIWIWSPGSVSLLRFRVQVFPLSSLPFSFLLFCQQVIWDLEDSGPLFVFSSLPPFPIGLSTLFGTPWAKGGVLARDLARWLLWRMGAYSPQRPPLASPAPTSLACPHRPRLPPCRGVGLAPAVMPGIGLRM